MNSTHDTVTRADNPVEPVAAGGEVMSEAETRDLIVELGASLFQRGYAIGSAGNISVRLPDGYLMTPTNASLGRLRAASISKLDVDWNHVAGASPSKEVYMHRAILTARSDANAVVHLHSTYATATSCLHFDENGDPFRPLVPYFVMRVGRTLPVVPYYRPGDPTMESDIHDAAKLAKAMLLANHGSVTSGKSLIDAVYAAEELEEAAKLALILRGSPVRPLNQTQIEELISIYG